MNWEDYEPFFTKAEFDCKETGENGMTQEFMDALLRVRIHFGKPMVITSGYRSPRHSIEARKAKPGAHAVGKSCDVGIRGADALKLIEIALAHGFTGVGVSQKNGQARFIHLDISTQEDGLPRPNIWSY